LWEEYLKNWGPPRKEVLALIVLGVGEVEAVPKGKRGDYGKERTEGSKAGTKSARPTRGRSNPDDSDFGRKKNV